MKILTILGARPQFIKASAISRYISLNAPHIEEIIVHTGQHFDAGMSDVFFHQLDIKLPKYNLGVSGLDHGAMTGRMLEKVEEILKLESPDIVLVYGDTNSTLAGALAAAKLHIPVAHVEAGLRSFNMRMPEEINRILTDRVSTYLYCPTKLSIDNLTNEGVQKGVYLTGDVMFDVTLYYLEKAKSEYKLDHWGLEDKAFSLCTVHRAENTDSADRLRNIVSALDELSQQEQIVLPLHPRTRKKLAELNLDDLLRNVKVIDPVGYLEMQRLEAGSRMILTDSGGVQKEAFFHGVPCITLRDETEWVETVDSGWNIIAGASRNKIIDAFTKQKQLESVVPSSPYGDGNAAATIVTTLI